jgi:hypothetical protein
MIIKELAAITIEILGRGNVINMKELKMNLSTGIF